MRENSISDSASIVEVATEQLGHDSSLKFLIKQEEKLAKHEAEEVASSGSAKASEEVTSSTTTDHRQTSSWVDHVKAPLLKRVEELELKLRSIEDKYSPRSVVEGPGSARSSCLSTPSGIERRRKPIDDVLEETEEKGTLVERVAKLEVQVDTLCMQLNATVPVLKAPPVIWEGGSAGLKNQVATPAASEAALLPAVEEKHEVNSNGMKPAMVAEEDSAKHRQQHEKKTSNTKKHKIQQLFKSCVSGGHSS